MSFSNPTSEVYFMTVPFSPDYKNVINFNSKQEQENAFKNLSTKHFTNINIIRNNKQLKIIGDFGDYYQYNYMMFKNPELDNKWWYAFIIDSNYIAKETTIITFEIDVWQTFQFDITYYRSLIERGIVPKNDDNYKKWTQPEPLNVDSEYANTEKVFNDNWSPYFCIESISRLYPKTVIPQIDFEFEYGGKGSGENYSSVYMSPIGTSVDVDKYSKTIEKFGSFNDHRTDILGVRVVPKWVSDSSNWQLTTDAGDAYYLMKVLNGNNLCIFNSDNYNISSSTLSNGYKPRNKKMLNSLCRGFMVYNLNGFKIILKPELFKTDIINIDLSTKPIQMTSIRCVIPYYGNAVEKYFDIPYDLSFSVAYNSNTGIQQSLQVFSAASQIAKGVIGVAGGLGTSGGSSTIPVHSTYADVPSSITLGNDGGVVKNPLSVAGGVGDILNGGVSLVQALSTKSGGSSSVTDLLHYRNALMTLQLDEYNPSIENCKVIDQFLDMYGYSINETGNILDWINTRSNWNYIKTNNCNLKIKGNATYEQILKNMFNNGVTIWHGLNAFGVYNTNRTDGVTINN